MRYQHDCNKCKPLGEYGQYDLYFCEQAGKGPTVVARYSNNGPDYHSGIMFQEFPPIAEATIRAINQGYIRQDFIDRNPAYYNTEGGSMCNGLGRDFDNEGKA